METRCPRCGGPIVIYSSHPSDDQQTQIRYFRCDDCTYKPETNKQTLPRRFVRRRLPRR